MHLWSASRSRRGRLVSTLFAALAMVITPLAVAPPAYADLYAHTFHMALNLGRHLGVTDAEYSFTTDGTSVPGPDSTDATFGWSTSTSIMQTALGTRMVARITDVGDATAYWIMISSDLHYEGGTYKDSATCGIYLGDPDSGGSIVDQSSASPYSCPSVAQDWADDNGTIDGSIYTLPLTLDSVVWSTVQGTMKPTGQLSLVSGYLESRTPHTLINDTSLLKDTTVYQTVPAGDSMFWTAYQRNGDDLANPTTPPVPQVYFTYRIADDGDNTDYWINGSGSNERDAAFHHHYSCDVYRGDPRAGGVKVTQTPYQCDAADGGTNAVAQLTFTVHKLDVITIGVDEALQKLPKACVDADSPCTYQLADKQAASGDPEPNGQRNISRLVVGPARNPSNKDVTQSYTYATGRSITNSFDLSVSAGGSFFDLVKTQIKATYGWQQTDETTKQYRVTMTVSPGCAGWITLDPSYWVVTGRYQFLLDGQWYQTGTVTWNVPDSTNKGSVTIHSWTLPGLDSDCTAPGVVNDGPIPDQEGGAEPTSTKTTRTGTVTSSATTALATATASTHTTPPGPQLAATGPGLDPLRTTELALALFLLGGVALIMVRRKRSADR